MSKPMIRPLYDRIVVQPLEAEAISKGGIHLTGDDAEKSHEGIVLAIGPGKLMPDGKTVPMNVEVGDNVLFGQYVGNEVNIDGGTLLILNEDEIIAILV